MAEVHDCCSNENLMNTLENVHLVYNLLRSLNEPQHLMRKVVLST